MAGGQDAAAGNERPQLSRAPSSAVPGFGKRRRDAPTSERMRLGSRPRLHLLEGHLKSRCAPGALGDCGTSLDPRRFPSTLVALPPSEGGRQSPWAPVRQGTPTSRFSFRRRLSRRLSPHRRFNESPPPRDPSPQLIRSRDPLVSGGCVRDQRGRGGGLLRPVFGCVSADGGPHRLAAHRPLTLLSASLRLLGPAPRARACPAPRPRTAPLDILRDVGAQPLGSGRSE